MTDMSTPKPIGRTSTGVPSAGVASGAGDVASKLRACIAVWVYEGGKGNDVTTRALQVLVVEDDALISTMLTEMLVTMGHDVCGVARTEVEAVAAARLYRPDLMIVDARLSMGSGIDAVDKILRTESVPCVFVSGDVLRIRVLRPNAIVLQKPFREADLDRAIHRALGVTGQA